MYDISRASMHDIQYLNDIKSQLGSCILIGDNGYLSRARQLGLFSSSDISLQTSMRKNKKDFTSFPFKYREARTRIETLFHSYTSVYGMTAGEIFSVKKNRQQKWAYYPNIHEEEAILIKGYDSDERHSCFAMHTAFALPTQNTESKPRKSIETRTFAFYDE